MKLIVAAAVCCGVFSVCAAEKDYEGAELWENPYVSGVDKLEARPVTIPCESEAKAKEIAALAQPRESSGYVVSLNGKWKFSWCKEPQERPRDFYKKEYDSSQWGEITVPGCWQLQGKYDPPIYVNITYPHAKDPPRIMTEPKDKSFTAVEFRNPVGSYLRTFSIPESWKGRKTILHFGGVASAMNVWINGEKVGYSEDSRLPAEFDATPYIKDGENLLAVEVYRWCDGSYLEDQDFWRLSGIFRDVWLQAEKPQGLNSFVVRTELSEDFGKAQILVDAKTGSSAAWSLYAPNGALVAKWKDGEKSEVSNPELWTCETPSLYTLVGEVAGDWFAQCIGFRKVSIEDAVLKVNGRRILVKGTDRHEMTPDKGYTITKEEMQRDIDVMKSFNVNAVRTSHYPNDPMWYDLCDRNGIYVLCEANIESHGMGYGKETLAKNPDYLKSHVERGVNMVKVFRNHACIIGWSMGNEAGFGPNFEEEYKAMRALDSTRPIQYEQAPWDNQYSDIVCPMYARPWKGEEYVKNNPKKPYILCEYSHAMGNSNGSIQDYWDVVNKYPSAQGGFIWDFVDQAVWKTPQNSDATEPVLAYGGDFGDKPNDGNFNCNGFVDALRNPHPGAWEIKHAYQNIHVDAFDTETLTATIRNGYIFKPLKGVTATWTLIVEGVDHGGGFIDVEGLEPGKTKQVKIPVFIPKVLETHVTFRFFEGANEIAHDQFVTSSPEPKEPTRLYNVRLAKTETEETVEFGDEKYGIVFSKKTGMPLSFVWNGVAIIVKPVEMNFWRAPIDNDRGVNLPKKLGVWKDAGRNAKLVSFKVEDYGVRAKYDIPAGNSKAELVWSLCNGGALSCDFTFDAGKGLPYIPRVGLTFGVPASFTKAKWYGLGPHENYDDRKTSALFGIWNAEIALGSGFVSPKRLNPDNYIKPGEQGYRTEVRWLSLGNGKENVKFTGHPCFGFNAWPYAQPALEGPLHMYEVAKDDFITVNIDAVQMGVGGDTSWRTEPHEPYQPKSGKRYSLTFTIQ